VTADSGINFPHAGQVFRVRPDTGGLDGPGRAWTGLDGQRARKEIAYRITSLAPEQANAEQLSGYIRNHWSIENRLHWVRDVTHDATCAPGAGRLSAR